MQKKNIPFNLTTWNNIIILFSKVFNKRKVKIEMEHVLKILESMNEDEIKPNIQTLNALLKMIIELKIDNFKDVIKYLIIEFKNMNIKFSLGTYYYIMLGFTIYGNYILFIIYLF